MRILITGNCQCAEFASAVAEMKRSVELLQHPDLIAAIEWLQCGESMVDLIVVAQARPGEFSTAAIEALRCAAPLAPMVALLGSWCEGEMRSGAPWPGVTRVYWHQWPSRFSQEVARLSQGELSAWNQPLTSTAEERLISSANPDNGAIQGVTAVVSGDYEMADWLATAGRRIGLFAVVFRQLPQRTVDGIDVVLWDAGLATTGLGDEFRRLAACFVQSPILVLLDFPRFDDVQQLMDAGAAAVLAKPIAIADLNWSICSVLRAGKADRSAIDR